MNEIAQGINELTAPLRQVVIFGVVWLLYAAGRLIWRNYQKAKPDSFSSRIDKISEILSEIKINTLDLESDLKEVSDRLINIASDINTIKELRLK